MFCEIAYLFVHKTHPYITHSSNFELNSRKHSSFIIRSDILEFVAAKSNLNLKFVHLFIRFVSIKNLKK